jgi:hypothetical protein
MLAMGGNPTSVCSVAPSSAAFIGHMIFDTVLERIPSSSNWQPVNCPVFRKRAP